LESSFLGKCPKSSPISVPSKPGSSALARAADALAGGHATGPWNRANVANFDQEFREILIVAVSPVSISKIMASTAAEPAALNAAMEQRVAEAHRRGAIAYIPSKTKKWDPSGPTSPWKKKSLWAGTLAEWANANPNPVPRDYAEQPREIRLRLNQRQGHVAAFSGESGGMRNRTTPLPAGSPRWKPVPQNLYRM